MTDMTDRVLGGCRIERTIGQGAMGEVFQGVQISLDRAVAIKILRQEESADAFGAEASLTRENIEEFFREARSIARLSHPNIVQVHDTGIEDGTSFLIMEFVDGHTLRDFIQQGMQPTTELAVLVMRQAAMGIHAAHEMGIIHRDIKPSNILVGHDWDVKVADFGLAAPVTDQTNLDLVVGTPAYMSPEQCEGQGVSKLSDMYSLGASFYHFLAGLLPFDDEDTMELMRKHVHEDPTPLREVIPEASIPLTTVIDRMMAKDPRMRYSSMVELIHALDLVERAAVLERNRSQFFGAGTRPRPIRGDARRLPKDGDEAQEESEGADPADSKALPAAPGPARASLFLLGAVAGIAGIVAFVAGLLAGRLLTGEDTSLEQVTHQVQAKRARADYAAVRRLLHEYGMHHPARAAEADAMLERIIREAQVDAGVHLSRVQELFSEGRKAAAAAELEFILQAYPGVALPNVELVAEEIEAWRRDRRANSDAEDPWAELAEARRHVREGRAAQGKVLLGILAGGPRGPGVARTAGQELEALKAKEKRARQAYHSGVALDETGRQAEAIEQLKAAASLLPGSVWARLASQLEDVVNQRHWRASAVFDEGEKRHGAGAKADALARWRRVIEEYPYTGFAHKARQKLREIRAEGP